MQIKTTTRYPLIPIRMTDRQTERKKISTGEDLERLEPLCTTGGNIK